VKELIKIKKEVQVPKDLLLTGPKQNKYLNKPNFYFILKSLENSQTIKNLVKCPQRISIKVKQIQIKIKIKIRIF
jgi:hypothetical protein